MVRGCRGEDNPSETELQTWLMLGTFSAILLSCSRPRGSLRAKPFPGLQVDVFFWRCRS